MTKFYSHNHIRTENGTNIVDVWHLVGPKGGISYRLHEFNDYSHTCNIEVHHSSCPHKKPIEPDQIKCWLIKAPCWHDGGSTAAELLMDDIVTYNRLGDDESIYRILEEQYYIYLDKETTPVEVTA